MYQIFHPAFPLVLLYTDESFPLVFNRILKIFHDFDVWDKNFHLMLIQQKSLQDLLNLSRDFLVHPMVVLDRNYSILGYLKIRKSVIRSWNPFCLPVM